MRRSRNAGSILALLLVLSQTFAARQAEPLEGLFDGLHGDAVRDSAENPDFTFVRIQYSSFPSRAWLTDFPEADMRFASHLQEVTGLSTNAERPMSLGLTDPNLSQYPFIYLVEGGKMMLSDAEVAALRIYLLGGGFLMVDDFWGPEELESASAQLQRVFPERAPVELPSDHDLFSSFYQIVATPIVPSQTIERGEHPETDYAQEPQLLTILDEAGGIMVLLCHNMDFGDAWERGGPGVSDSPPSVFYNAFPMGVNIIMYALDH